MHSHTLDYIYVYIITYIYISWYCHSAVETIANNMGKFITWIRKKPDNIATTQQSKTQHLWDVLRSKALDGVIIEHVSAERHSKMICNEFYQADGWIILHA